MTDPCGVCRRREACRLPLNCERYLAYHREADRLVEDQREARQAELGGEAQAERMDSHSLRRFRAMAAEVPWRKEGVEHGEKE